MCTAALSHTGFAHAESLNLAPGFETLPKGAKVVIMPTDIELFSLTAGGVQEPKADWTEAASRYFRAALIAREKALGLTATELNKDDADELSDVNFLHAAVAQSIALHHFGPSNLRLPTKDGKLDWSLGESVASIKQKTGADYAVFSWVRDSYTSSERAVAMFALALVGVGVHGGSQVGYASLVDLNSGRILWFNKLARASGDLREPEKAKETVKALLEKFPVAK
ncbi:hypothetical protein [Undibacterium sp.]|uniref:hypothetical protein n=1 Tax=Undibacterium sp. TaxID=1914977 RepID=UPI002D80D5AC|nr:hypothetical protein [Undibacterium sp.]